MRIKFLKGVASVYGGFSAGVTADIPDKVAQGWCDAGIAEEVKGEASKEKPSVIPKGKYWCGKCQSIHKLDSPRGKRHHKYLTS